MQLLSNKALSAAVAQSALSYDRSMVTPGVLHFSTGNFHRAHQGHYFHDLLGTGNQEDMCWGLVQCSTRSGGSYSKDSLPKLKDQDYLFTLVEMDDDKADAHIIGCIVDMLPPAEDHQPIKEFLMDPDACKIVSMTVTEGGYFLADGTFNVEDPAIQKDAQNPDDPQTWAGLVVQALAERKDKGLPPFTVMSCDNVPHNGDVTRAVTTGLAKLIDDDLAQWIDDNVEFPNSMVDRITPAPTESLAEDAGADQWEFQDKSPVFCEPFRQWVLEDKFTPGCRPNLEKVGVTFVEGVGPYENMKLRILNGGHASLCYPAALLDIEYVHEAMEHPVIGTFLNKLESEEIVPGVAPVPDTDLQDYWQTTRRRFTNPKLADRIDRNCYFGSDRQPKFIVPSIKSVLDDQTDRSLQGLATVSAMWARFCQGKSESGKDMDVKDVLDVASAAEKAKTDPVSWLKAFQKEVYGSVADDTKFQQAFTTAFKIIMDKGVEAAMKAYIDA
jgi:mannitol 2-dehydrogenase